MFLKFYWMRQIVKERSSEDYEAMNFPKGSKVIPLALVSMTLIGAKDFDNWENLLTLFIDGPNDYLWVGTTWCKVYIVGTPSQIADTYTPFLLSL